MKNDCRHLRLIPTVEEHKKTNGKKTGSHMLHQQC